MKKIIVLMGIPGSGKGTQAKKIAKNFGYLHISTGDLVRGLAERTDLDEELQQALVDTKEGKLVSDNVIYRLAFEAIDDAVAEGRGIVLDGAIRNLAQANAYQDHFEQKGLTDELLVLEFALTDDIAKERLLRRGAFAKAGKVVPGADGVETVRADDQDEEIIIRRIKEQGNEVIAPILAFFKERGVLASVDASQGIAEVDQDVTKILENT